MHVKNLNTIKPKAEAYNVDILLAFILRNKICLSCSYNHWDFFSSLRNLICSYISQLEILKMPICRLSFSKKDQFRGLGLSTGKYENSTWWEVVRVSQGHIKLLIFIAYQWTCFQNQEQL